jgi:tetratricopeptide (TPR) repeat protein
VEGIIMVTRFAGQLFLFMGLFFLLLCGRGLVDGQEKGLTPEERKRLESEARRLDKDAVAQYGKGNFKGALRAFERALAMYERLHPGRDHPDLATNLNNLGVVLYALGQPGNALSYYERALAMRERLYPKQDHPDLAQSLNNLGFMLRARGQPRKALSYYERALAMRERLYPKQDHPDLAMSLDALGSVLQALGEQGKALPYCERTLAMRERLYPKQDHPDLASSLYNLGLVLNALGQPGKALPYCERTLAMRERLYPKQDHPHLAQSLNNLGVVLRALEQPGKALLYYERALAMRERLYPKQDRADLAGSLYNLGYVLNALGQSGKALPYCERALAMRERLYPKQDHPDLALSLSHLGTVLDALGQPGKALPYYERALAMRERLYPKQDREDLARSLNNLGVVLSALGQRARALPHYERAVAMRERLYPKQDNPEQASSLENLGATLAMLGQPGKALPYFERALAMYERLYPKRDHLGLADSLNNMGGVLQKLGQHAKALPYHERALAMRERLHPKQDHPDLATSLNNLAAALSALGQSGKALPYCERVLAMRERLYPKQDRADVASSLHSLGVVLNALGQPGKALRYSERAVAMYERLYPKQDHPGLAGSLTNLGAVLKALGQSGKALPSFERALAIQERLYGNRDHPDLADSLYNLGNVVQDLGQPGKALPYLERALAMYRHLGEQNYIAHAQALAHVASLPLALRVYLSISRDRVMPNATYDHVWASKVAVTRVLQGRHAARAALTRSPALKAAWDELVLARGQLTFWVHNPGKDLSGRDREVRRLTERAEELERLLGKALPELPRRKVLDQLGPTDLAADLPEHTAFIDLIRYHHYEEGKLTSLRYVAFVVPSKGKIERVELKAAKPIDRAVDLWRQAVSGWSPRLKPQLLAELQARADKQAAELHRLVWAPLARHLPKGTRTVYLAPDGNLARFAFAALPGSKPGTVLLQELTLAYVPHGPFLLERLRYPPQLPKGPGEALLVGGVRYDRLGGKTGIPWQPLQATAREVGELKGLARGRQPLALAGLEASTDRLLKELPRVRYAHFATHGFFDEEALTKEKQRLREQFKIWRYDSLRATEVVGQGAQSPLVYAGLVLAGANDPQRAGPGGGVLSGEVISELPLEGLRLAVLSACETGLGELTGGEAVQSLQLAFHVAGCPDVVASLWQVNDKATAVLMAKFYHELWAKGRPPVEALRQAQLLVYLRPDLVEELSGDRGPPRVHEARLREVLERGAAAPAAKGAQTGKTRRAATKLWAAFILSGTGQ